MTPSPWPRRSATTRPGGYRPPPTAQATAAGYGTRHGLPTPAFRKGDFENELFEAEFRERNAPVSVDQARQAMQSLPETAQRGLPGVLMAGGSDSGRRELAYRATAGEWSAEQREALRTLAAATPDVRAQALATSADDTTGVPPGADVRHEQPSGGGEATSYDDPAFATDDEHAASGAPTGRRHAPGGGRDGDGATGDPDAPSHADRGRVRAADPPTTPREQASGSPAEAASREPRGPGPDSLFPNG